jgi:hypothetical protein
MRIIDAFDRLGLSAALIAVALLTGGDARATDDPTTTTRSGTYYSIRPDLRLCPAPLCGGFFVSAVNRARTQCADGTVAPSCYVTEIDWDDLDTEGSDPATLVLGKIESKEVPGFGPLGVLVADKAWRPATDARPKGTFFGHRESDVVCSTSPCPVIEQRVLNRTRQQLISTIALKGVNASPEDLAAAKAILARGGRLIAAGRNVVSSIGGTGGAIGMVASQFYLPIPAKADPRACKVDSDCTRSSYLGFVSTPEDCYCPTCAFPLNVTTAERNEKSWERNCSGFGFPLDDQGVGSLLVCPQIACITPAFVGCVAGRCEFLPTIEPQGAVGSLTVE